MVCLSFVFPVRGCIVRLFFPGGGGGRGGVMIRDRVRVRTAVRVLAVKRTRESHPLVLVSQTILSISMNSYCVLYTVFFYRFYYARTPEHTPV